MKKEYVYIYKHIMECICVYIYIYVYMYIKVYVSSVTQLCKTLCDPMDYSLPGSSVLEFSRQEYWSG